VALRRHFVGVGGWRDRELRSWKEGRVSWRNHFRRRDLKVPRERHLDILQLCRLHTLHERRTGGTTLLAGAHCDDPFSSRVVGLGSRSYAGKLGGSWRGLGGIILCRRQNAIRLRPQQVKSEYWRRQILIPHVPLHHSSLAA
jgi:hypothetical protein